MQREQQQQGEESFNSSIHIITMYNSPNPHFSFNIIAKSDLQNCNQLRELNRAVHGARQKTYYKEEYHER
jgi:hypothetical protein